MREAWGREDVHLLLLLGAFWVAHTALHLSAACGLQSFVCTQLGSVEGRLRPAALGLGKMRPPVVNCPFTDSEHQAFWVLVEVTLRFPVLPG